MQVVANSLSLAAIYLIFALGMSLVWATTGILNFAHGALFLSSIYAAYVVTERVRAPLIALIAIGVAVGAVLAALLHLLVFNPIIRRARSLRDAEYQILVAGIGADSILLAIIAHYTLSQPFSLRRSSFVTRSHHLLGVQITNMRLYVLGAAVILACVIGLWMRRSRSGLALRAIGMDAETASLMGVNKHQLTLGVMALSGALAGLSGVMLTMVLSGVDQSTGDNLLIKGFAVVILGGVGSMLGAIAGAVLLAGAETLVNTYTSGTWVDALAFGLILLVLLFRPQGLLGRAAVRRT
jgi:branched-chain amino acid transport system permease protein